MVKKYIKKPIPIEAVQFDGSNFAELEEFAGSDIYMQNGKVLIHTLEGEMVMVNPTGNYLIRGIHGEYYFCEKSVFEESYEEVKY